MLPIEPVNVDQLVPGDVIRDPYDEAAYVRVVSVQPQYKTVHLTYAGLRSREQHHIDLPYTAFFMTYRGEK
jgi:hypothetical protein